MYSIFNTSSGGGSSSSSININNNNNSEGRGRASLVSDEISSSSTHLQVHCCAQPVLHGAPDGQRRGHFREAKYRIIHTMAFGFLSSPRSTNENILGTSCCVIRTATVVRARQPNRNRSVRNSLMVASLSTVATGRAPRYAYLQPCIEQAAAAIPSLNSSPGIARPDSLPLSGSFLSSPGSTCSTDILRVPVSDEVSHLVHQARNCDTAYNLLGVV